MTTIISALQAVKLRIESAALQAGREPQDIRLLAVSKTFPAEAVREAFRAGQTAFGESYVQEAVGKVATLSDLPLEWHFIGPLQSNKTRLVAENFDWVHSVDRAKIADRLSSARPADLPPLQVCLEVNVSGESSKSGVSLHELEALAAHVSALPRLQLRGLMAIPVATDDAGLQRQQFRMVRELLDKLNHKNFQLDTLSMGMSNDLEAAVAEGASIVRVGSAIFGARSTHQKTGH
ncbi:MAG: YggS family pyridoxal phosphate-dependent enzyme [Gammaproteobacteria bacterium]|nr:YggS family pyridoxal phosphate-dependent enzyme [Gammaproteobacteria bacterium]MBU1731080.1 YggS family pyridoxal phosphate-dependent enzyme [Gammaproteobacteria bacterium]MBU1894144.1 YggS family pyridoxal phosphate-dependent enzyme [Gammaproteobacteria bacterium]